MFDYTAESHSSIDPVRRWLTDAVAAYLESGDVGAIEQRTKDLAPIIARMARDELVCPGWSLNPPLPVRFIF